MRKKRGKNYLKIGAIVMIVIFIISEASYLFFAMGHGNNNKTKTLVPVTATTPKYNTSNKDVLYFPFRPGNSFTLEYVLKITTKNGSFIADTNTINFTIESIKFPYIITNKGIIPIEFIYPITPKIDPHNPHILYGSFYLSDWSCMLLSSENHSNVFSAYPKTGCSKYLGTVVVNKYGILKEAKLVVPIANGLLTEYVYLVAYSSSGVTEIHYTPNQLLCYGPLSKIIYFTAPGAYMVLNRTLIRYIGKANLSISKPVIILSKNKVGNYIWEEILSGNVSLPYGSIILVDSPLFLKQYNRTNILMVNGKIVANGTNIISWIKKINK